MSRSVERAQELLALLDAEDIEGAEAKAEVLWATDREAFWWLLDRHVARGRHSLTLGLVLLRAVRALPRPDLEALGGVFRLTVQRLVPEEPRSESTELLACAQLLLEDQPQGESPAWLRLGLASAHTHHLNWLASQEEDQDLTGSLRHINELFADISSSPLSAREHLQFAMALAHYAGLTGDGRWLSDARASLVAAEKGYPDLVPRWAMAVLIEFAKSEPSGELWREVVQRGESLLGAPEPAEMEALIRFARAQEITHYRLAIAYGFLGHRAVALSHLAESVALNRRRIHQAVSDNDMGPLFSGAGHTSYTFFLSPEKN